MANTLNYKGSRGQSVLIDIIKEVTSSTVLSIFGGEWGMGNGEWGMGNGEWGMGNGAVCGFVRLMYRNRHTLRAGVRVGGPIAAPQHPSLAPFFSLLRRCPNLVIPALTERTAIAILAPPFFRRRPVGES